MSQNPNKKELANSLSQSIYEGITTEKVTELISQLNRADKKKPLPEIDPNEIIEEKIGIYVSKMIDGKKYFVRDPRFKAYFNFWPKIKDTIPEKSSKKRRVVLFGESVARGWFYEPFYSPASVLEEILCQHFSPDLEVVDLAVTSFKQSELLTLCEEALVLSPDTYIFLAGNNWRSEVVAGFTEMDGYEIYKEIVSGNPSYEIVNRVCSRAVERNIEMFFSRLKKIVSGKNIKVLFIIPEFNLVDFQSSLTEKEMFMPNPKTKKWLEVKESGEKMLEENNLDALSACAKELIILNPFHPLGYEWLAKCSMSAGQIKSARDLLQAACDTAMFRASTVTSRIYGSMKKAISSNCDKYNINKLSLEEVFAQHSGGKLPDRTLYMDYCHMTVEATEISMKECAKALVKMWTGSEMSKEVNHYKIKVDNDVISIAHFLAALHNNLCNQSFEIIDYHCRRSFEYNKNIIDGMRSYVRLAISEVPWKINKDATFFLKNNVLDMGIFSYEDHARVDSNILRSIRNILDQNNLINDVDEKLVREHVLPGRATDLLQPKFATDSMQCLTEIIINKKSFYSEIKLESKFNFVASSKYPVDMEITYRVPNSSPNQSINLFINDQSHIKLPAFSKWSKHGFTIPASDLKTGVNSIAIKWPLPSSTSEKQLSSAADIMSCISPTLGEINALKIEYLTN